MCDNGWDDFKGKIFIEVPQRFVSSAELKRKDYNEVLQKFMEEYCSSIVKRIKNSDITITNTGKLEAVKRLFKKPKN